MSERKNIDRLFQEKFKDFEAEPSEQSWKNIEARLKEKKKRRVIPLWFKAAGVAAVLLLSVFLADSVTNGGLFNQKGATGIPSTSNGVVNSGETQNTNTGGAKINATPGSSENPGTGNDVQVTSSDENENQPTASENGNPDLNTTSGQNAKNNQAVVSANDNTSGQKIGKRKSASGGKKPSKASDKMFDEQQAVASDEGSAKNASRKAENQQRQSGNVVENQREAVASAQNRNNQNGVSGQNNGVNDRSVQNQNGVTKPDNQAGQIAQANEKTGENPVNKNAAAAQPQPQLAAVDARTAGATKLDSTAIIAAAELKAMGELLNEKENKPVAQQDEQKIDRWQVSTRIAPIYLSSANDGSSIDPSLSGNSKEYKTTMSYGVGASYAVNKRLSVRAGVNSLTTEYNTNGIAFSQNSIASIQLRSVNTNLQGRLLSIQNASAIASIDGMTFNADLMKSYKGSISQRLGYIEVPLELSYKLIDSKFGVEVIGGMSTLFLRENEVAIESNGVEMGIGEANNLNNTHFSGNIGLGLKYSFLKSLQFNVEPMLKYQVNPYTTGNFQPFFFGIYTGLNYRF